MTFTFDYTAMRWSKRRGQYYPQYQTDNGSGKKVWITLDRPQDTKDFRGTKELSGSITATVSLAVYRDGRRSTRFVLA